MILLENIKIRIIIYFLSICAAISVPVFLWASKSSFIYFSYGKNYQLFELFGFCASVALLLIGYIEIKRFSVLSLKNVIAIILLILVSFHFLIFIVEYSFQSSDYKSYENATKSLIKGDNPYKGTRFLYPPLTAQSMDLINGGIRWGLQSLHRKNDEKLTWFLVFYLYQCCQFLLIVLLYLLSYSSARKLGLNEIEASLIVAALLVFNNPLIRTLRNNQVNLYIVNIIFLTAYLLPKYPRVSGFIIALGGQIKIYPLLLGFPLALMKKWKAIAGVVIGTIVFLLFETHFFQEWKLWNEFLSFIITFPPGTALRDNGIYSVTYQFVRFSFKPFLPTVKYIFILENVLVFVWFYIRFLKREKQFNKITEDSGNGAIPSLNYIYRIYGHIADISAIMLLVSPRVWEHHYILALPTAIWAIAIRGREKPFQISACLILIFALPTFDMFPFSYHRVVALITLLFFSSSQKGELKKLENLQYSISAQNSF